MDSEPGYDTTNLHALQDELRRLNATALAEGLLGKGPRPAEAATEPAAPSKASQKRGKAAARRLLAIGGRLEGDDSPAVPGTEFTEAGVVRLIAFLRRRRGRAGAWSRFLARVQRALGRPVSLGQLVVAGVSLTRVQVVYRQICEVEAHGLAQLTARRVLRRGRVAAASALMLGGAVSAPEFLHGPSQPGESS